MERIVFFSQARSGASGFEWATYFGIVLEITHEEDGGWVVVNGWVMKGSYECAAVMLHL